MSNQDNPHFNKIFWFIVYSFTLVLLLAVGVIFIPIPKENFNLANTVVIFFLGNAVGAGISYLVGGNPVAPNKTTESTDATKQMNVAAEKVNVNQKENEAG